jgi:subtilisin family serine protease
MNRGVLCNGLALILIMGTSRLAAASLELLWSTGQSDLVTVAATECTLLVRGDLPSDWRLAWVSDTDEPLTFTTGRPAEGFADVCTISRAPSAAAVLSRIDSTTHCSLTHDRTSIARYRIHAPSGVRARIVLLVPSDSSSLVRGSEVTINGGILLPVPAVVNAIDVDAAGADPLVTLRGHFDGRVRIAIAPAADMRSPEPLVIVRATQHAIAVRLTSRPTVPSLFFVHSRAGHLTVVSAPVVEPAPSTTNTTYVLRFLPAQAEPPEGTTGGAISEFTFASPTALEELSGAGITRLDRLLPWFTHEHVHTFNTIGEPIVLEDLADLYVATVSETTTPTVSASEAGSLPFVRYASLDPLVPSSPLQPPPYYPSDLIQEQWNLDNDGQSYCQPALHAATNYDIDAPEAWGYTQGYPSVAIAFLDTGIDTTHDDFGLPLGPAICAPCPTRVRVGPNFTDDGKTATHVTAHGTAVAGIAAATADNIPGPGGLAGVAYRATPWSYRVLRTNGTRPSFIASAIDYGRAHGIPILNMSLGADSAFSPFLNDICLNAFNTGIFLVAASGNLDIDATTAAGQCPTYPAGFRHRVCAVGAMWLDGNRWRRANFPNDNNCEDSGNCGFLPGGGGALCAGSTFGDWIDLVAPGGDFIFTTKSGPNSYFEFNDGGVYCSAYQPTTWAFGGTSAAAPHVSGTAALLKSVAPYLLGEDIEQILKRTARQIYGANGEWDHEVGYGLIKAGAAVNYVKTRLIRQGRLTFQGTPSGKLSIADSIDVQMKFISVPPLADNITYDCKRYRLRGAARYALPFDAVPDTWVRSSGTRGWRNYANPEVFDNRIEVNWGRVDSSAAVTADSAYVETFVYRVKAPGGSTTLGWFPSLPESAAVAFTAAGPCTLFAAVPGGGPGFRDVSLTVAPNPVARRVVLEIKGADPVGARIAIHDVAGRQVATLTIAPGESRVVWDLRSAAGSLCGPGVYFARVDSPRLGAAVGKFVVLATPR